MARPIKDGVDYFPFDVALDEKFDLIEAEFGLTGFAVVVKLYQKVYSRGYYCEWTDEVALLFGRQCGLGGNVVSEIVSAAIKRGIFDKRMNEKYQILTSAGIQKRYFEAVARRKCVNVDKRYLLIDVTKIIQRANINEINVDINPSNELNNPQRKGKETKGKEIKEKDFSGKPDVRGVFRGYAGEDHELLTALSDFAAMRTKIKKPLTPRAAGMIVTKLEKLRDTGNPPVRVLEQSVLHCWQDVYEIKGEDRSGRSAETERADGVDSKGGRKYGNYI